MPLAGKNHPLWDAYETPFLTVGKYWNAYGGWWALARSPYFHGAFVITCLSLDWAMTHAWWDRVLSVIPNLLGFTLTGFALLLTLGGEAHQRLLARAGGRDGSVLRSMSTAYVHFVFIQCAAMIVAWVYEGARGPGRFFCEGIASILQVRPVGVIFAGKYAITAVGMLLAYYSIFCALAMVLRAFHQVEQFIGAVHQMAEDEGGE